MDMAEIEWAESCSKVPKDNSDLIDNSIPSWQQYRRSMDFVQATEPPQQQHQQHHHQQHHQQHHTTSQQPTPVTEDLQQSYRPNSQDMSDATIPQSLTPFRFMQPREFSLGSNVRRSPPAMPLPTSLPADMSRAVVTGARAKKTKKGSSGISDAGSNSALDNRAVDLPNEIETTMPLSSADDPPKSSQPSSSCQLPRSSARSSCTMGRIPEEEGSRSNCSSGLSSQFSASLLALDEAVMGGIISQSLTATGLQPPRTKQIMETSRSQGSVSPVEGLTAKHELQSPRAIKKSAEQPTCKSTLASIEDLEAYADDTPVAIKEDDRSTSSSDSDSSSFLSWDRSKRSAGYMQGVQNVVVGVSNQHQLDLDQLTDANPYIQQQQQHVTSQTKCYDYSPPQQQQQLQSYHTRQLTPQHNSQAYDRKVSSDSISSHSPTPFRSMLPRELLIGNNLRRVNPTLPFPTLPANSSVTTTKSTA